jgi:hypothetical protein
VTIAPGCVLACAVCAAALAFVTPAGLAEDPDLDGKAVQTVCGRCHSTALFERKPQSWERWNDVFADMTQRGATGTDEQLVRVTRYFLENLTLVNVNSSPAEELTWVLGVREEVAQDIIARRMRRPFANIAELLAVPGVDGAKLEQRKSRILF